MPSEIILNGQRYVTTEVQRELLAEFNNPFRTTGTQKRADRTLLSSYEYRPKLKGFGRKVSNLEDPESLLRFWDSRVETRFPGAVVLPILNESVTISSPEDFARVAVHFKGKLWVAFEKLYSSANITSVASRTFDAATPGWTGGGTRVSDANSGGMRVFDMVVHKGKLVFIGTSSVSADFGNPRTYSSSTGTSWSENSDTGLLSSSIWAEQGVRNLHGDQLAKLVSFGNTLVLALNEIDVTSVWKSTDAAANWTQIANDLSSAGDINGKASYFDQANATAPVFATENALYAVDITNNEIDILIDYSHRSHSENGRGMVLHNSRLYIPMGDGGVLEYFWVGDHAEVREVGPNRDDGLPAARRGHALSGVGIDRWVFFTYGGHTATTNASILALDLEDYSWHSIYYESDANVELPFITGSSENDDVVRLIFTEEAISPTSNPMHMLTEILASPDSGVTIKRQSSGVLQLPTFDGGMPEVPTNFLEVVLEAESLSATTSGEWIDYDYGTNGAAYTTTDLGDFLSGDKDLTFGSGLGISAKTLNQQLTLHRGSTNTNTPLLRNLVLNYLKVPATRYIYRIVIDLEETARTYQITPEDVITNLQTVQDSVTMVSFKYSRAAAVNVKALPEWAWRFAIGEANYEHEGMREGELALVLVKLL